MAQHIPTHASIAARARARPSIAVIVIAGVVALAGCSPSEPSEGPVTPASSITMVAFSAGQGQSSSEVIAAAYEEATGVHIDVDLLPPASYDQAVRTQLQAGSAADLIAVTPGALLPTSVGSLVAARALAPITDSAVDQAFLPGTEDLYTFDGKIYAVPTSIVVYGLLANDQVLQAVGGSSFPTTFEDLLDACRSTGGAPAFVALAGSLPFAIGLLGAELAANYVYAEDPDWATKRAAGDVTFAESEGWQEALEAFVDMNSAGCFQGGAAGAGYDVLVGGLLSGQAATAVIPSLVAGDLLRVMPDAPLSVHVLPAPEGSDGLVLAGASGGYAINAAADPGRQAAAQNFVNWVADPANSELIAAAEGGIPVTAIGDVSKIPALYAPIAAPVAAGEFTNLPDFRFANAEVSNALGIGLQSLLTGQGTVDEVLRAMDAAWDN